MENGTGVYYQAMPAVGPDGKNVMKLIPVQKVNGQFVQTQVLAKNGRASQDSAQPAHTSPAALQLSKLPTLQPTVDGRYILKTPPQGNTLFNSVKSQHRGANELLRNADDQIHVPLLPSKVTALPHLPVQNNDDDIGNAPQLPVTMKSSALPSGHYLRIPPNAIIRTVPTAALPQSVQNRICNSGNVSPNRSLGLSTVVCVSPVNTLKPGPKQQVPPRPKSAELSQPLAHTPTPTVSGKSLSVSSASSPKPEQGLAAPKKWLVKEGAGSVAPRLIPLSSPNMTADILEAVKHMEGAKLVNRVGIEETGSAQTSQENISAGANNALLMCNGKVFFVTKKNSDPKGIISGTELKSSVKSSSQTSSAVEGSNEALIQNPQNDIAVKKNNEIIDLCDDDDESSQRSSGTNLPAEKVVENDDDSNVIFVSYIPPKSETETSKSVTEASAQMGSDGKDMFSPESVSMELADESSAVIDQEAGRCLENIPAGEEANHAVSEQPDNICDPETDIVEKVSEDLTLEDEECKEEDMALDEAPLEQTPQKKSDPELRQIYGIKSDLRVCLERKAEEAEWRSINKRNLEDIRKLIHESDIETKIRQLIEAQMPTPKKECPKDAKRRKLEQDEERTEEKVESGSTSSCQNAEHPQIPQSPSAAGKERQTTEQPCSSPPDQSTQTQTAGLQTGNSTCSLSHKTPEQQSKGSTACPCGTKVRTGTPNTSPELQNEPGPSPAKSPEGKKENNNIPKKVAENFVAKPRESKNVPEKPREKMLPTSQADACKGNERLPQSAVPKTEVVHEPEPSSQAAVCRNSNSNSSEYAGHGDITEKSTIGPQKDAIHNWPDTPRQMEQSTRVSTAGSSFVGESIPREFYSPTPLDPEEIKRQERIRRLKDRMKEQEAALEKMRNSM